MGWLWELGTVRNTYDRIFRGTVKGRKRDGSRTEEEQAWKKQMERRLKETDAWTVSTVSPCAWMLASIMMVSPVSNRSLHVSYWSKRLQTWWFAGPGTNNWRPESGPVTGLTVSKTVQKPVLCVCATHKQPVGRNSSEPTVHTVVRFAQVLSCLCLGGCSKGTPVLVLVHMAGWLHHMYGHVCVPVGNTCSALLSAGPVNTKQGCYIPIGLGLEKSPLVPKPHQIWLLPIVLFYNHHN